jgi:alkylated DNA repair protein (DNA oxidative demethylase)
MDVDAFAQAHLPDAPAAAAARTLQPGAVLLSRHACARSGAIAALIERIAAAAPFRHFETPLRGARMSAAMTNCGAWGWTADRRGYRYTAHDPDTGRPWPAMPGEFSDLAEAAAHAAGFENFHPDACLINRYAVGAGMGLHQDKGERDLGQPIVSVSLGCPVIFQLGGMTRSEPARRVLLEHGDVFVFGGPSRLRYHGVLRLRASTHPLLGALRINLTFRRAQ